MLSESLVADFTRSSMLQERLVRLVWPDLSTSEKLQIVQAVQESMSAQRYTPNWLMSLAVDDKAAIVRVWAAKHAHFTKPREDGHIYFGDPPTEEELAITGKALRDDEALVRYSVDKPSSIVNLDSLTTLPQEARLFAIATSTVWFDDSFIKWLDTATGAGVPDREIAECAYEFFNLPKVKESIVDEDLYTDPWNEMGRRSAMRQGWDLTNKAGERLRHTLAWNLPFRIGRFDSMKLEELEVLPEDVIETIVSRARGEDCESVWGLVKKVREHPENFSERVRKQVLRDDEFDHYSADDEEKRRYRSLARADSSKAILEEVHRLEDKIQSLNTKLNGDDGSLPVHDVTGQLLSLRSRPRATGGRAIILNGLAGMK